MEKGSPTCTLNERVVTDLQKGFFARPARNPDGTFDMMQWICGIPGKKGVRLVSSLLLMSRHTGKMEIIPWQCTSRRTIPQNRQNVFACCVEVTHFQGQFPKGFFHPNVYPSGTVCLSILNEAEDWRPAITIKQILLGIQELLDNPNEKSPAQEEAFHMYT